MAVWTPRETPGRRRGAHDATGIDAATIATVGR